MLHLWYHPIWGFNFLSTTTFGILSVLLAFGSLVVGILALLQYRKRRRLALHPTAVPQALPILDDVGTASLPLTPLTPITDGQRPPNAMSTLASSSTSDVQISAISTSSTLVPDTISPSGTTRKDAPSRPLLSNLRKRSSQFQSQSQRLKISYRTSTY